jgi:hypothetical protein
VINYIETIVSGGQTGVDRAGLDVAMELGIPCGGWCPKGRRAVDGVIPAKYPLKETETQEYKERTRLNVLDSDGTLILNRGELSGGTKYTVDIAKSEVKPYLIVALDRSPDPQAVIAWIKHNDIHTLNVAGPREEGCPGIYDQAVNFLREIL